ncbi:MAG: adenylosuccinate synthase [Clostridiaceae bacterium]|nr:adenylosuccinate synthase [Eubacteriales bacterium]
MATCAVVGVNWGDEGKGRMVDLIAKDCGAVVRYQGGSNAGHTVINEYGKFALNLIPSGIFTPGVVNVLGNGTVIDPEHLVGEIERLRAAGVRVTGENLKISDRAILVFPFHKAQDALEEARLKDAKYGSTKRGISPVYGDKYMKKGIMAGELLLPEYLKEHLSSVLAWKNLTIEKVYGEKPYRLDDMLAWLEAYGAPLKEHICDAGAVLRGVQKENKKILFEAQLGALRDIDYGIYPYTSSSSPLAAYAPVGAGAPDIKVDEVVGVVKAYSTCVGEGPFTAEWHGEEAERLREAGGEYGAATGRPRRVGPIDLVATRYGARIQGTTALALTKLDVLSYMERIPVCVAYELDGQRTEEFPFAPLLAKAKPVVEYLPGWQEDISAVRAFMDLPKAAREYVLYLEKAFCCPISYVSVGARRDDIILR